MTMILSRMKQMNVFVMTSVCFLTASFVVGKVHAQEPRPAAYLVGTKQAAPFAMKRPDGTWEGISIDLWKRIARDLDLDYEWVESDLQGILTGLKNGSLDFGVAALTITPQREEDFDFSHPFYNEGLGIAVLPKGQSQWIKVVKKIFSLELLKVLAVLALVLLTFGFLVWVFEREKNSEQFGGKNVQGIWSGFWWSAVTMTTVGYGDKAPKTMGGRLVALIWMFTAIIIISSFTAAITSVVTVSQLETGIHGPEDLTDVTSASLTNSTGAGYLKTKNLRHTLYSSLDEGLTDLKNGKIDAFVYDAPILNYIVSQNFSGSIKVLPRTFEPQQYGIGMRSGSPLREEVNRKLLEITNGPVWKDILEMYLGTK